jgi:Alw26I/Eco31I/Esp3I family type II restriction m6 adenine DNA methyltransferase
MLDSKLDPASLEPLRAVQLAAAVDGHQDISELFQELNELSLSRTGRGQLALSRGRTARRRSGLFFTPQWMARRLSAMALDPLLESGRHQLRILDPACGSGRLLFECLDRILAGEARAEAVRELAPACLRGVDIDPLAVALAKSLLWLLADPNLGSFDELDSVFIEGDAISGPLTGRETSCWESIGTDFDVIVANPPFEVLKGYQRRKELKAYVQRIRKSGYSLALSGNLNTYRLFLERSLEVLAEGGRLAFVLPFGFLMDRTAAPLRLHMLRSGWIELVETYPESSRAFSQVGQSVVLLSAVKSDRVRNVVVMKDGTGKRPPFGLNVDRLDALDAESLPIPIIAEDAYELAARMQAANQFCVGALAEGRVGEVDQTIYRRFMKSQPAEAVLVRGTHLSPYRAVLEEEKSTERWLNLKGFARARGGGRWREDVKSPRAVQTGIVNMEAGRRLVAAEVPEGVYLGNSLNYWVPNELPDWDESLLRGYLLGLLNSAPLEWRFRVTSSNNNINLYEVKTLPIPQLTSSFPQEGTVEFLDWASRQIKDSLSSVVGTIREISTTWGSPNRDDRAVAKLIGGVARLRESEADIQRAARLDAAIDCLVNWHLGLGESDLDRMLEDLPARARDEA